MKKLMMLLMITGMLIGIGGCVLSNPMPSWDPVRGEFINMPEAYYARKKQALERRQEYCNSNPGLDEDIKRVILNGSFRLGMTGEQVVASIGWPRKSNHSVGSWGTHRQWIYYLGRYPSGYVKYLYFENGILTSWQN